MMLLFETQSDQNAFINLMTTIAVVMFAIWLLRNFTNRVK